MSVLDIDAAGVPAQIAESRFLPAPRLVADRAWSTVRSTVRFERIAPFSGRMVLAVGLTALAYAWVYADVLDDAVHGSRATFLVVAPVLLLMIAWGHRSPTQGVGDGESDWIVAVLAGTAGFTAIHLLGERMPSLAALWRLPMLGLAVWMACLLAVLFGIRHVVRMWGLWLFALVGLTPLPLTLATAAFGGSDTVSVLLSSALAAVATVLALPSAPLVWRLAAGAACVGAGAPTALLTMPHTSLLAASVVAGGVAPLAVTSIVHVVRRGQRRQASLPRVPHRSRLSLVVLTVTAAFLALTTAPSGSSATVEHADAAWLDNGSLGAPTDYPFITQYLGGGARLQRYPVVPHAGEPAAAVDVISTENATALGDLADAVWYPSTHTLQYHAADPTAGLPAGARIVATDAGAATSRTEPQFYAVTWTWAVGRLHQQVTVIVDQTASPRPAPPEPTPLSLPSISLRPALWLARQQPDSAGGVEDTVRSRAEGIAAHLLAAAHALTGTSTRA